MSETNYTINIESQPAYTIDIGTTGTRGKGATVAIGTTTTLHSGLPASVSNVGTSADAVLDFSIPKGSTWYNGVGIPSSSLGVEGDYYVNTDTNTYYEKTSSTVWTERGTAVGDVGVTTIVNAVYSGTIDGSNTTFALDNTYDNLIVYLNGLKVNTGDYTWTKSTKVLEFNDAPLSGYALEVNGIFNKTATLVDVDAVSEIAITGNLSDGNNDAGFPTVSSGITAPTSTPAKVGDMYVNTVLKQTYVANGTSSSANWIKQNGSYTLFTLTGGSFNPADATTYFWGGHSTQNSVNGGTKRLYILKAGTITSAIVNITGTGGTSETSSLYIRVNNTTDYLITNTAILNYNSNFTLNIPVSAGDYIEFKWVTPTWVTNPTGVFVSGAVNIDL